VFKPRERVEGALRPPIFANDRPRGTIDHGQTMRSCRSPSPGGPPDHALDVLVARRVRLLH
jgi:hypothetical protein